MIRDDIRDFYARPHVRKRIEEYLGAGPAGVSSCVYLAQPDLDGWPRLDCVRRPESLQAVLDRGADLSRSLWDRESLIAHLDIEYVNFDFPHEAYLDPRRTFRLQRPVCAALEKILGRCGIKALHMISGRGHHYAWRMGSDSRVFHELAGIGSCSDSLLARYRHTGISFAERLPEPFGKAFAGLGLVMEYLAGMIKREAGLADSLPVELTDVVVGSGERGREMVSIDISEYGDPLYLRVARVPFSAYLKPGTDTIPQTMAGDGDFLTTVAPPTLSVAEEIAPMHDLETTAQLAESRSAIIPDASKGTAQLLAEYRNSRLHAFHTEFHAQTPHPPGQWASTYDKVALDAMPPCAAQVLAEPNDLLMKPACIEMVVRTLLALGWKTRHVAGLIRSRYERDYGWGTQWLIHDAATRADFYTRFFAGLFFSGIDDLVDFNCRSLQERDLCRHPCGHCNVHSLKEALLERRNHG